MAMQVGMWFGYITLRFVADRVGRKRAYAFFVLRERAAAVYGIRAARPAAARAVHCVLWDRTLQWVRAADGRILSHDYPRDRAGIHYNAGRLTSAARRL